MNRLLIVKICVLFLLNITLLNGEKNYLNIDAKHFDSNQQKNILIFTGDVKMTKNNDILLCQKLVINTVQVKNGSNNQIPKDYKATGNVSFTLHTNNNKILKGKGDTVLYYPDKQKYILIGNAFLEDTEDGKKVNAEKINIDEITGRTKIDGGKNKPIKFRLRLNEPNEKNITKGKNEKS